MRDTLKERERGKEKERDYQNLVVSREGEDDAKEKKCTKRRKRRREWAHEKRSAREREEVGKGREARYTEGEESGPFDGAFVGSRGALRFATKIVALLARVRHSPRRVICGEFINATRFSRDDRTRVNISGRAEFDTRAYSIELLNFHGKTRLASD